MINRTVPIVNRELLNDAAARAIRYLEELPGRRVGPAREALSRLSAWDAALPEGPTDPAEVLRALDELGSPGTMAMAGGRFFGFVIGGALPVTVAANWLATAWDQNTGLHTITLATAELERIALGWLLDLLGLPPGTGAGYVTGATLANFTALAAARHAVLGQAGWDVEAQGLFGAPPVTVVVGAEAHPAVLKSLGLLGFGRARVVTVPVDRQGRMRPDALPPLAPPAIVCLQAGNVNSGAFDPAAEIVPRAKRAGAWVHVDGAFGLWAAASPRLAHLAAGLEAADSWATDAHKWLNVPYDCGLAFSRDAEALRAAMAVRASYLPTGARDPSDFTPELSRRARGVEVWAALRALGRAGLAAMLERNCRHARRFAEGLAAAGYEVLNEVVLNQVVVSFGAPEVTGRVIRGIQEDGTCWCGGTVWQDRTAMRISVCSWATTDDDVEKSLEAMLRIAARGRKGRKRRKRR
jgi:glutamate/tyrosine decarboxylase-like PLP-dependent enzyme